MTRTDRRPTVLLAESDAVVAMDVSDILEEAGYRVLGPAGSTVEALRLLVQERAALAVIDVALRDGPCTELVHTLRRLGVPFLVHSGLWQDQRTVAEFRGAPWLIKPALHGDIAACMNALSAAAPTPAITAPERGPVAPAGDPLVRKLEGFAALSEADKAVLAGISAEARPVPAGTDLIREGDAPDGVFLVTDGIACRYKLRANGARQIMAYLLPGDACDLDVTLLARMDHSVSTLSACRVARIAPRTVEELLRRPALARALRMATLVDEATAREWLVNVGRRSAGERLAHLFCELRARMAAVGRVVQDGFDLPITQADLADTTGLTAVHVNRSLQELRRQGLIDLAGRRLTIRDLPGLTALAEFRAGYLHLDDRAAA